MDNKETKYLEERIARLEHTLAQLAPILHKLSVQSEESGREVSAMADQMTIILDDWNRVNRQ